MKTLYLECAMGAAGDMLMAALYDLMDEEQRTSFINQMNNLGLDGVEVLATRAESHGISGSHMHVVVGGVEEGELLANGNDTQHGHEHSHGHEHGCEHEHGRECGHTHEEGHACDHEHAQAHGHKEHQHHQHHHHHHHATPEAIAAAIAACNVGETVRQNALAVYSNIAAAEAKVHGTTIDAIHYHEVGAKDAVADVVGVCLAISMLAPDAIVASPIRVGTGTVVCAHGTIPVPAPATAELLRGVPSYGGDVVGETCTPTGAALVARFASSYGPMPQMAVERCGYGIGERDFGRPNCLRAFLGEVAGEGNGKISEIVCKIDDMSPEQLAHACARLLERGALDAYTLSGTMKKGRAGHLLTVLCQVEEADSVARAVLQETTSNGLRIRECEKYFLEPHIETVATEWGDVRVKVAEGYGTTHIKPEFDDVSRIATEHSLPIAQVDSAVREAFSKKH